MKLKLFLAALSLCSAASLFADANYMVTSSSRLNVRRAPSTRGAVLGTFKSGQEITVLSITSGWAKVEFNNSVGYVSAKFIRELPKKVEEEEPEEVVEVIEDSPTRETPVSVSTDCGLDEVSTPLTFGSSLTNKLSLYLALQGGAGYSTFIWSDSEVYGDVSFSIDIVGQLYFEDKVSFIPRNWYSELAIGYDQKGAADFKMGYLHACVYPFGYRIPLSPVNIVVKGGISLGLPLNDLKTSSYSWSSDFQCGIGGGFQVEWKQFAVGCNVAYDLTEVSASCGQTLHNVAVLGTISYKFAKLGHK